MITSNSTFGSLGPPAQGGTPKPSGKQQPVVGMDEEYEIVLGDAAPVYHDPLVICASGHEGGGKSNFLGTAPGLGLIATEFKSKGSVLKSAASFGNNRVIVPKRRVKGVETEVDLVRVSDPKVLTAMPKTCIVLGDRNHPMTMKPGELQEEMQEIAESIKIYGPPPSCCRRHYFRWHVDRVKDVGYQMLYDPRVKVIAVDTFGQFVKDTMYANYGLTGVIDPKEFGFAPREDMVTEIREFLNAMNRKHLILTHHQKDVWKDNKPVPGKKKPDSEFSQIGHYMTVQIEQYRRSGLGWVANPDGWDNDRGYQVVVRDCTANPGIISPVPLLYDDDITFENLAMKIYPDAKEGEFD